MTPTQPLVRTDRSSGLNRSHVAPPARPAADAVLRDVAYVLHLTRRVREEIQAARAENEALAV